MHLQFCSEKESSCTPEIHGCQGVGDYFHRFSCSSISYLPGMTSVQATELIYSQAFNSAPYASTALLLKPHSQEQVWSEQHLWLQSVSSRTHMCPEQLAWAEREMDYSSGLHTKSPAQREKHRDNRNTKMCFFRTWLLKLKKTRKYMKWQQVTFPLPVAPI